MQPGALTRIPANLLDRPARLIRHFAAQERPLIFLLYFNVVAKRWLAWLPRQKSTGRFGSIADMTFQQLTPPLTNDFRLAGSLITADVHLWGDIPLLLPSIDGIHLRMHVSAWCALSANVVADGKQFLRVDPSRLLSEQLERRDLALMQIIRS